jgi:SBF-like CPA transporter family (DUF4137)
VQVKGVHVVTFINICIVFLISGLTLRTDELKDALTRRTITGTVFAFVSIIGLTPNPRSGVRNLPLHPEGFIVGLTIFCIVPTTLGVGVSLVTSAKVRSAQADSFLIATEQHVLDSLCHCCTWLAARSQQQARIVKASPARGCLQLHQRRWLSGRW